MPKKNNQSQLIIYQAKSGETKIDVRLENENVWLSQKSMAQLFGCSTDNISLHLKNIFKTGELRQQSVSEDFSATASDGKNYTVKHYNLDAIISVGYRVKSLQGTHFRKWATQRLKEYITQGFTLNEERLKSGKSTLYFDKLQAKLREIRLSERLFYQKIKDIYTTSIDYDPKNDKTIEFFKIIQNKLLWAISQKTAAEIVHNRADHTLPFLGMQSFHKETGKSITKKDASVAKNYLNEKEMKTLGLLVEQYLAFAETMAESQTPMRMIDWIERLDVILQMSGKEILTNYGKISHALALAKSKKEYGKFKENRKKAERTQSIKELETDIKLFKSEIIRT